MRSVIHQVVSLPAPAERLFEIFVSAKLHGEMTGSPVKIGAEPGSPFWAFDGALSGYVLHVESPKLIVMSWRSTHFLETDPDSTLILRFTGQNQNGIVNLLHLDVPEQDFVDVQNGWEKFYWAPWRRFLES